MVRVYDLAHSRAGDKGDISNISVIAYDEAGWAILREQLTEARVMQAFAHIAKGPVCRYELPRLRALNFVIERALGGGVTRSLALDVHGKSYSSLMLAIELPGGDTASATTSDTTTGVSAAPAAAMPAATSAGADARDRGAAISAAIKATIAKVVR